jgi:hypothetical protein
VEFRRSQGLQINLAERTNMRNKSGISMMILAVVATVMAAVGAQVAFADDYNWVKCFNDCMHNGGSMSKCRITCPVAPL